MIHEMNLDDIGDFLECAEIHQTIDLGHTVIHVGDIGTPDSPCRFVMMNDHNGKTILSM